MAPPPNPFAAPPDKAAPYRTDWANVFVGLALLSAGLGVAIYSILFFAVSALFLVPAVLVLRRSRYSDHLQQRRIARSALLLAYPAAGFSLVYAVVVLHSVASFLAVAEPGLK